MVREAGRLRWRLARPVANLLAGPYRSAFKGGGIEFADARPYEPGDDWRRIHWSLSARKNQPYLRLGQEERELTCVIAIDRSPSMFISSEKAHLTLEVAVALALAALLNGDRVRWVSFTDQVEYFSPARRGERHIWGSLNLLLHSTAKGKKTRLLPLLSWFQALHPRRTFLVVISDLFFQDREAWKWLKALSHKHFIFLAGIRSAEEALQVPWGFLPFREVETGATGVAKGSLAPTPFQRSSLRSALFLPSTSTVAQLRAALLHPLR